MRRSSGHTVRRQAFREDAGINTFATGSLESAEPPSTRYQGSKRKLLRWIGSTVQPLPFHSALDAFGGTACVSYLLKGLGKQVTYNDYLQFNRVIAEAIIVNSSTRLQPSGVEHVLTAATGGDDFISRTFADVFYTDEENRWLDRVAQTIPHLATAAERAIAYYALFQACIVKRPYNLFHRKNLYMRTSDVPRSFGNKATWDTPFEVHFRRFVDEANHSIFDSGVPCHALNRDALDVNGRFDLVYIDTPYINRRGTGVDYLDFYHFLEGLLDYPNWAQRLNTRRKHLPLLGEKSPWSDPKRTHRAFTALFERFRDSILVVSYRSDGIPSELELIDLLRQFKTEVTCHHYGDYTYALSKNRKSKELLLVGR